MPVKKLVAMGALAVLLGVAWRWTPLAECCARSWCCG
jgi:hypothetical protein